MPIKNVKIKIFEKQKNTFFLMSRIIQPKNWVPKSKGIFCSRGKREKTEDTLSGFQECFLQPIIKDRSNILKPTAKPRVIMTVEARLVISNIQL